MNYLIKKTKIAAFISLIIMLVSLLSGFGYYQGIGQIVFNSETYLAQNAFYEEKISINATQGVVHSFSTEIKGFNNEIYPYVFVGDVVGRADLSYMKNLLKDEGLTVIAGINGDFYDTATGVPLGMSMHEGKIKNSGLNYSFALGFRSDGTAFASHVMIDYTFIVNSKDTYTINHINKPKGAANSLHFYNSSYASSTRTTGSNIEVILTSVDSTEPAINTTINAQVKSIGINVSNTILNENEIVLSADANTSYGAILASLLPGDSIAINANDINGGFVDAVEAIGVYELIAENGIIIPQANGSNPRTCIGIKPDGSIILYAVDGRRPGHSVGMSLKDVGAYLIERGCTTVVNMDGGGSTTMLARMPGDSEATLMNLPSDGKERNVSNALFIVSKTEASSNSSNLHLYPMTTFVMPGATVNFAAKSTDYKYLPTIPPSNINYTIEGDMGEINNSGVFSATRVGEGKVIASGNGMLTSSFVNVTDQISINPNVTSILTDVGKVIDINVKAYSTYVPVVAKDNLFTWSCDERIGTIDQNGVFTTSNNTGLKGNIYITFGTKNVTIPVQIGAARISFLDTNIHWAKDYIEVLAGRSIVNGMGDNLFNPDGQLTKAQFLTMLSKLIINNDVTSYPDAGFTDVDLIEWYVPYVNWGYANKIITGNPDKTFAPNSPITREQMTVILNNFSKATGVEFPVKVDELSFTDQSSISQWAMDGVSIVVKAGIMKGRPEGNFDPQGFASRAEASTVTYAVMNMME
jgi:hypothetical protein